GIPLKDLKQATKDAVAKRFTILKVYQGNQKGEGKKGPFGIDETGLTNDNQDTGLTGGLIQ
ncbi:hypothetical protein, partial [Sulfuricurvum sp.]|uniref:hypothetical protein n=1 Tax=Sulfuricurvum sp. TaxID=2025608 RepID=UPI003566596C